MITNDPTLFANLLHQLFEYKDGKLYRKVSRGKSKPGEEAGHKHSSGYVLVEINHKLYKAHRLIWLMHNKCVPQFLDHVNGDRADNRIENLRVATKHQNNFNMRLLSTNVSGFKGVHWHKGAGKWRVQIRHNGKRKHIGYFDDIELADLAASEARSKYHGEFARDY